MSNKSLCRGKTYWNLIGKCPDCNRTFTTRNVKLFNKLLNLHVIKEHNRLNVLDTGATLTSEYNQMSAKMIGTMKQPDKNAGEYKSRDHVKTKKSKIPQ